MESFEKILTNCDVLQSIFLYLDFKEHLKLIKICPQFEYAIVHGIWRLLCKNLNIREAFTDILHLQYNGEYNVKSLTSEAIHIILHHSSLYIRKLELNRIRYSKSIISLKYHHLTELSLRDTVVENTHLQQLAENCLNLQSFTLINFTDSRKESNYWTYRFDEELNICANVFSEMKALNKLEIYDRNFTAWDYFDVRQLFSHAHLKTLIIDIYLSYSKDNKGSNNNNTDRVYNIENLTIGELFCVQSWNVFLIEDLICFENLTKLSIRLERVAIDNNVLTQINNACPKLCELSFTHCHFSFNEFPHMNNLMHLTFKLCFNIRLENFNEIFRKLTLKSLSLVGELLTNEAEDISNYNYTSNTLEALTIKGVFDPKTVTTFCNRQHKFENVFKVRLLESFYRGSQSTQLCFSHNFPNLQELIMDVYHISNEDILYLKHLKVLQFDLFDNMSWSYLKILFQHPTLTHITITPFHCRGFKKHYERLAESCEGLTTTMEYLGLPSVVYESALSFWPCFRQRNKLLKLEIVDCDTLKSRAVPM